MNLRYSSVLTSVTAIAALTLAVGAENLFDQYPDPFPPALNLNGGPVWSNYSPFGRGGRYVYGRATYAF